MMTSLIPKSPAKPWESIPKPLPTEQQRIIKPDVLLITLLDDLNVTLGEAKDLLGGMTKLLSSIESSMERIPQGVVETYDDIAVTSTSETVFDTIEKVEQEFYSATVYNQGPNDVQVRFNDGLPQESSSTRVARRSRYATLAEGESVDVDFKAPLLRFIYYKLKDGGTSATIKIVGEW